MRSRSTIHHHSLFRSFWCLSTRDRWDSGHWVWCSEEYRWAPAIFACWIEMLSQLLLTRVLLPLGFGDQEESKRVAWATAMGLYSLPKSKRSYSASQPSGLLTRSARLTHLCSAVEGRPGYLDVWEPQSLYTIPRHILRKARLATALARTVPSHLHHKLRTTWHAA